MRNIFFTRRKTKKIILYRTIFITGLSLVRKIFYYEFVKQEKCIYFMVDTSPFVVYIFFERKIF